jgi:hypothetical protein
VIKISTNDCCKNDRVLQSKPLCAEMREARDFDEPTKRSIGLDSWRLNQQPDQSLETLILWFALSLVTFTLFRDTSLDRSSTILRHNIKAVMLDLHKALDVNRKVYSITTFNNDMASFYIRRRESILRRRMHVVARIKFDLIGYWRHEYHEVTARS